MKITISPKVKVAASIIGGLFALWLLIRACSAGVGGDDRTFIVAQDVSWYPLDLRGKEHNMVVFTKTLLEEIAKLEEIQVEVIQVGSTGLYDGLDQGTFDVVFSYLTPNVITERAYVFSDLFYALGPVLVVRDNENIHSLDGLKGKVIGIEAGTLPQFQQTDDHNFIVIPYPSVSQALENLARNAIDAVILDVLRAYSYTHGFYEGRLKIVGSPLVMKGIRLAARNEPRYHRLMVKVNAGLQKLIDDGTYDKLIERFDLIPTMGKNKHEQ